MLLVGLVIAGESVWGAHPLALIPVVIVLVALAVVELWLRRRWLTRFLMWLTLEELIVQWTALRYQPELLRYVVLLGIGLLVLGGLISKIPLPENGLPVRGLWLRRFLAGVGLICLTPWPIEIGILDSTFARTAWLWPEWMCVPVVFYFFVRTAETLAQP